MMICILPTIGRYKFFSWHSHCNWPWNELLMVWVNDLFKGNKNSNILLLSSKPCPNYFRVNYFGKFSFVNKKVFLEIYQQISNIINWNKLNLTKLQSFFFFWTIVTLSFLDLDFPPCITNIWSMLFNFIFSLLLNSSY